MSFKEQIRQFDSESEKIEAGQLRNQNIHLLLIGIISLFIIFLLLSHSFIINTRIIEFMGMVAMLIVFEFIYLLLHPFLEQVTDQSHIWMLVVLVGIAAVLVPFHHKLEKWTTSKLAAKNKVIRLAVAKKTLEELENK